MLLLLTGPVDVSAVPRSAAAIACGPTTDNPNANTAALTRMPLRNTVTTPPFSLLTVNKVSHLCRCG
jgi:hypothetical protein